MENAKACWSMASLRFSQSEHRKQFHFISEVCRKTLFLLLWNSLQGKSGLLVENYCDHIYLELFSTVRSSSLKKWQNWANHPTLGVHSRSIICLKILPTAKKYSVWEFLKKIILLKIQKMIFHDMFIPETIQNYQIKILKMYY